MRIITFVFASLLALAAASSEKKIVCYHGSWTNGRSSHGRFDISHFNPKLCTHFIYAFVPFTGQGQLVESQPPVSSFTQLRNTNPKIKLMIAVGGANTSKGPFSAISGNPTIRKEFIKNIVAFVKSHNFDGVDIDWEYPEGADKNNFVLLLKELREECDENGLILSVAVGASEWRVGQSYNIREISKYVHFVNLMTYDIHGTWQNKAQIHAPLYAGPWEKGFERVENVDYMVKYWLKEGTPAEKLVLGVPFYGRTFTLTDSNQNFIGAPITGTGAVGPYSRDQGSLTYNEICEKIKNEGWHAQYENEQRVPYAYKGNQWVGYDNERSLAEKAAYSMKLNLGGIMIWSIDGDDMDGHCNGTEYPLLKTINQVLHKDTTLSSTNKVLATNSSMNPLPTKSNVPVPTTSQPSPTSKVPTRNSPIYKLRPTRIVPVPIMSQPSPTSEVPTRRSPIYPLPSRGIVPVPTISQPSPTNKVPVTNSQIYSPSKTHQPQKPTRPEPNDGSVYPLQTKEFNIRCKNRSKYGVIRDPARCDVYYPCIFDPSTNGFYVYKETCRDPLVYDLDNNRCEWRDFVKC